MWHECWNRSLANGVPYDQPALREANRLLDHPISYLQGIYNVQFGVCLRDISNVLYTYYKPFVAKAKVLHYYSVSARYFSKWRILTMVQKRVKAKGHVDFLTSVLLRYPRIVVYDAHLTEFRMWIKQKLKNSGLLL